MPMAINDFDQAARYVARHLDPIGLFHWLLGDTFADLWEWREWLDTQAVPFPGAPERRSDTVATFDSRAMNQPPLALVIEFMSHARQSTLLRMTQYTLQIHHDCPYQRKPRIDYTVIGAIINLTGRTHGNRFRMRAVGANSLGVVAQFKVRNLQRESATELLQQVQAGTISRSMLVWAPLMQDADTAEFIAAWRSEVERDPKQTRRGDLVGLAVVFAELAKRREAWVKGVAGMNDVRSEIVMEWEAKGEQRGIAIGEQRGIVIGEQRGIVIGEQRGEQQGKIKGARNALTQCLQIRFNGALPNAIARTIAEQTDLATLESWLKQAFVAGSLDAFLAEMDGAKN